MRICFLALAVAVLAGFFSLWAECGHRALHEGVRSPVGMAYDARGNLFVAEWSAGRVSRFSPQGVRSTFASLPSPSGLAISPSGGIWVASYSNDVIYACSADGECETAVKDLRTPAGIAFDSQGRLLVCNRASGEVLRFTFPRGGEPVREVLASGLATPVGVAELRPGRFMIACISGAVYAMEEGKAPVAVSRALAAPAVGILAQGTDAVLVADYGGSAVWRVSWDGASKPLADGFASPVGLARSPDGRLATGTWGQDAVFSLQ